MESRSTAATLPVSPVSATRSAVVANSRPAGRDVSMDYGYQMPPTTTIPPQALSYPASAVVTYRNLPTRDVRMDHGSQAPHNTFVSSQATCRPTPAVAANGNIYSSDDESCRYQTLHGTSLSRKARTASAGAVFGYVTTKNVGTDSGY
jgi:hypothetical protein